MHNDKMVCYVFYHDSIMIYNDNNYYYDVNLTEIFVWSEALLISCSAIHAHTFYLLAVGDVMSCRTTLLNCSHNNNNNNNAKKKNSLHLHKAF